MAVKTATVLSEQVINTLQDLIQMNLDSRDGYRLAAGKIDDLNLAGIFDFFAQQRETQASELSKFVIRTGERPRREGTYLAVLHRSWMEIRTLMTSDDRLALLEEAERGEDAIKSAYEEAVRQTVATPVHEMLREQCLHVKAGHDRIRDLRNEYRCGC
jgi:uncharacterized protein (TIGR02284 family)